MEKTNEQIEIVPTRTFANSNDSIAFRLQTQKLEQIILSETSKNQVVMFGERHIDYRKDSDFVIKILPELKKQGFDYFALESPREPTQKNSPEQAILDYVSGIIRRDSIDWDEYNTDIAKLEVITAGWLDLIDKVRETSTRILCYDADKNKYSSWNEREEKAFENLKEMIFNNDPGAKVIVYCGSGHINGKEIYNPYIPDWETLFRMENKDKKFKCLAHHLKKHTQNRTLTVSLVGQCPYVDCDITIDFEKNYFKK